LFGASGGEFKYSLAAVTTCAVQLLCPGVVLAMLLSIKYSLSSLDKSYGLEENCPNPEAFTEG